MIGHVIVFAWLMQLCYVVLGCDVLCHVILCCRMLGHHMLCYATLQGSTGSCRIVYCIMRYHGVLNCVCVCCVVLFCCELSCTVLNCIILCCTLYCCVARCIALCCALLYYVVLCCVVLQYITSHCMFLSCNLLYHIMLYHSVLYYVVMRIGSELRWPVSGRGGGWTTPRTRRVAPLFLRRTIPRADLPTPSLPLVRTPTDRLMNIIQSRCAWHPALLSNSRPDGPSGHFGSRRSACGTILVWHMWALSELHIGAVSLMRAGDNWPWRTFCMHVQHVHARMHRCMHVCIYTCTKDAYVHAYVCVYTHAYTCMCISPYMFMQMYMYTHACMEVYMYVYVYGYMYGV